MSGTSPAEFEAALTPERLRTWQVLFYALGTGVCLFWGVVVFLHGTAQGTPRPDGYALVRVLSFIHAVAAAACYFAAGLVYSNLARQAARGDAEAAVNGVGRAMLVRLILMEGPAYFGLVVCLLGVLFHVIDAHPLLWLNSATTGIMLVVAGKTFPTAEAFKSAYLSATEAAP